MIADLQRAVHLVAHHLDGTARELGVTQAEAHVLAQLHRDGPQTVGQLVEGFGHKRSTLTNILDRLEQRTLITRETNPRDRRTFTITLTRSGVGVAARVAEAVDELERSVRQQISSSDVAAIRAVANALARA
jgi:DNA-binding MarR family transcriptional regulator